MLSYRISDADMMPCYEYFAEGIKHITSLESFKIVNYNLPQSPWLENSIFPVLEQNSNLTALQLSNCFLSSDDLTSLTKFLAGNRTLSTLNICSTNIESEDTVKALAKALKKHPAIRRVNLAYCSLAGGHDVLDKILTACKTYDSLEIGHEDFESESVAAVAKFLGKKHSLTSFSLVGAAVDKENKKLLSEALVKNKTIQKLCLHSNNLQLPAIIRNTKKITKSLCRLTHLDLSFNKLPLAGAKAMATFLDEADCNLVSLIMSNNHLTTKGANVLLPALKKNTSLQHLDLSHNWLSDKCAPTVIDLLKHNSTLLTFDLSGNKGLKTVERRRRRRYRFVEGRYTFDETPHVDGGRAKIVKEALFDTTSLESIISSNHTCSVRMTGFNHNDSYEESIRKINALDVREGKKIRLKIVLAKRFKEDLFDLRSFDDVPLELMPYLLEMLHQEIGCDGYGGNILQQWANYTKNQTDRWTVAKYAKSLSRLYETIKTWQSLPALFARGPGEFCLEEADEAQTTAKKKKRNPRKRRKFGDEEDDDDEAWIPKGARKTGEYKLNPETGTWEFIPPPVY
jgi:Ran GTPase-activating protein (RanGAP) involved in mRNA processing and transport